MKALTLIERKIKAGEELNKTDLIFLYEINAQIEGFGDMQRDGINQARGYDNADQSCAFVKQGMCRKHR